MRILMGTAAAFALVAGTAVAEPMIDATGATASGSVITFPMVMADAEGYLVIHEVDADGNVVAPQSIGHAAVMAGENADVAVDVGTPVMGGTHYAAMLHAETNGNATYDFGVDATDVDTPVMAGGQAVVTKFTTADAAMDDAMAPDAMGSDAMADDSMAADAMATDAMAGDAMAGDTMAMGPMIALDGIAITGDTVTFADVSSPSGGYLVIHAMVDGAPVVPASIGHVAIPAGESKDVAVAIDYDFVPGETYMAMLHDETNGNATYDFGEGATDVDTPTMRDGAPVTEAFAVGG